MDINNYPAHLNDTAIKAAPAFSEKKRNIYAIAAVITIAAMLIGGIGMYFAVSYFSSFKKASVPKNWTAFSPANCGGLTIETPFKLAPTQLEFPPDIAGLIKNDESFKHQSENITVVVSYIEYLDEVKADVNGAAQATLDEMKNLKGVSKFDYSIDFISTPALSGRLAKGSYRAMGIIKENFIFLFYTQENKLWQVNCIYRETAGYDKMAERIMNSVKIETAK